MAYGQWNSIVNGLPKQLKDVLFVTRGGNIHKGCVNLRNTWIIQNCDGLIPRWVADENLVTAWMDLPGKDDAGWRPRTESPEPGSYVLAKDWLHGEVRIVYVESQCRWIIRNAEDDHITFWMTNDKDMWMPMPENK